MSTGTDIHDVAPHRAHIRGSITLAPGAIPYLWPAVDVLSILLACALSALLCQTLAGRSAGDLLPAWIVGLLASLVYVLRIGSVGHYEWSGYVKPNVEVSRILGFWIVTALLLAFSTFGLKLGVDYSSGAFVIFVLVAPCLLLAVRRLGKDILASAIARGTMLRRDIVVVGDASEVGAFGAHDMLSLFGATDVTRFALSSASDPDYRAAEDKRILAAAIHFSRVNQVQQIALAFPWGETDRIDFVRRAIRELPIAARLVPDLRMRALMCEASFGRSNVTLEVQRAPLSAAGHAAKRAMDVALSTLALCCLMPLMALTAVAIKLDSPGPVIFRQRRKGLNGREFVMFKFRSMTVEEDGAAVVQARRNDPRVTRVGRLLRASSIDELPQLLNILRGDMSLIGPRPHAIAHDSYFQSLVSEYVFRHHVKPGLTGWAQCNGSRGATPSVEHVAERVKLDLWYIDNWSFWLDLRILVKTAFEIARKSNAY